MVGEMVGFSSARYVHYAAKHPGVATDVTMATPHAIHHVRPEHVADTVLDHALQLDALAHGHCQLGGPAASTTSKLRADIVCVGAECASSRPRRGYLLGW